MEGEKKTKLKKMKITSVDMVRRGANQDAYINLYKSERASPESPEPQDTDEIPQGLWKSIVETVRGFMRHSGNPEDEPDQIEKAEEEEIEKRAESFEDTMKIREVQDNRWKYQDALNISIDSILKDEDLEYDEKIELIEESIDQFSASYKELCAMMLNASQNINDEPENPEPADDVSEETQPEGEREMKIDKSRFTPEELTAYEALIAKGMVEDDDITKGCGSDLDKGCGKKVDKEDGPDFPPKSNVNPNEEEMKDDMKGLHPEVKKALQELEDMKKSMAMDQMKTIAKKYAPLGKKEDELANTLYEMKKSGDSSYDSYIALLDENLSLVEKSGMFEEIGKSGAGYACGGCTVDRIETIATEIQKSDVTLSRPQAIMKAWEQHPELIAEYDKEYAGGR